MIIDYDYDDDFGDYFDGGVLTIINDMKECECDNDYDDDDDEEEEEEEDDDDDSDDNEERLEAVCKILGGLVGCSFGSRQGGFLNYIDDKDDAHDHEEDDDDDGDTC